MFRFLIVLAAAVTASGVALAASSRPADLMFAELGKLCGQRFAGRVVTTDPADAAFADKPLVMIVASCNADEIRVPFAVGEDRSRTWIVSRTATGLRLKHDHRHEDGTEDELSQYGGDTLTPGTATRQEFPADAFSRTLFLGKGNPKSVDNVWALELKPGRIFAYELRRPNRRFRVEFDLTRPL